MNKTGYDIIGDIHGHSRPLEKLLMALGYAQRDGTWVHSERIAIFAGDFVDRGPDNLRTCRIVMDMMGEGSALAVMGNHDFNAVCLTTLDPERPDVFLRPHTENNLRQSATTLRELQQNPEEADVVLSWMKRLPLWIERDCLKVVHAAWSRSAKQILAPWTDATGALTAAGFMRAAQSDGPARSARELFLNGPEKALPGGLSYLDADGIERAECRLAWWAGGFPDVSWRQAAILPTLVATRLPEAVLPPGDLDFLDEENDGLLIFGHYSMGPCLRPLTAKHVCVDASIAHGGRLAAYRFSGEKIAKPNHLIEI